MDKEKIDLENFIFNLILDHELTVGRINTDMYETLKKQHEQADITYEYTKVGFFFNYSVNDDLAMKDKSRHILGGVNFKVIDATDTLMEVLMFISNGKIGCTEGHGYGDYLEEDCFSQDKLERVFL